MADASLLETGGLLAALLAVLEVLKRTVLPPSTSKPPAPLTPAQWELGAAGPPPSWWERLGKIEAKLEGMQMYDQGLHEWLARIEQKLDRK